MSYKWFDAAENGDLYKINTLLAGDADVNAKDNFGYTALMYAARKCHLYSIEKLLAVGADVNAKDTDGYTALMYAANQGNLPVVEKLLAVGADVNDKNNYGKTALMYAAWRGHLPVVEKLIDANADVDAKDNYGNTAVIEQLIIQSIKKNRYNLTEILLVIDIEYSKEEKELVKKFLVKRYGNILMVLWDGEKYPGFTVFEAIMDNFCPTWKKVLTLKELFELCVESKYIVRGTRKN